MKRYYKIYSNACRTIRPITEISEKESIEYIVDQIYSEEDPESIFEPFKGIDWDDDDSYNRAMEEVSEKAINYFNHNKFFECGDFTIISLDVDEEPIRANAYGHSVNDLY